jgi:uracil-DNA glycosylase family protein
MCPAKPHPAAESFHPHPLSLRALRTAAQACTACDLYRHATQAVLGEGPRSARLVFVGEQPGDREDREGKPFVGPAGQLLDELLATAGILRQEAYVTNAVKHFKWEPRGKRRLHQPPTLGEARACQPWLAAELSLIRPLGVVCLGATAAQCLLGSNFRLTREHGRFFPGPSGAWVTATLHPAAILRTPDLRRREAARRQCEADLAKVAARLAAGVL